MRGNKLARVFHRGVAEPGDRLAFVGPEADARADAGDFGIDGEAGAGFVRIAVVQPMDRLALVAERLAEAGEMVGAGGPTDGEAAGAGGPTDDEAAGAGGPQR